MIFLYLGYVPLADQLNVICLNIILVLLFICVHMNYFQTQGRGECSEIEFATVDYCLVRLHPRLVSYNCICLY